MVDFATKTYNKNYYHQHKKRISDRRKLKYRTDQKYRKQQIERSIRSYRLRYAKRVPADRTVVRAIETGEKYFSISKLAKHIGRGVQTIRWYHKLGVIPEPKHTDLRGWRLYTKEEVLLIQRAFRAFDKREIRSLKDVGKTIQEGWGNLWQKKN